MSKNLKRKDNETLFEWKLRLCLAKLNREIDEDWSELVEILEMDINPDHLRKTAYGMKETYEYFSNKSKEMISQEEYERLLEKELELNMKKVKTNKGVYK